MSDVLIVDDEDVLGRTICQFLGRRGLKADYAVSIGEALHRVETAGLPSVSFVDYKIGRESGIDFLILLRRQHPGCNVVMMTGHGNIDVAVRAMKEGASDFLIKPVPLESIAQISEAALRRNATPTFEVRANRHNRIIGHSTAANRLQQTVDRVVDATSQLDHHPPCVLISGESGTGKTMVAKLLHQNGAHATRPFRSVGSAGLTNRGVSTGQRTGPDDIGKSFTELIESTTTGTLLIEEIDQLSSDNQAQLLQFIETQVTQEHGGHVKGHTPAPDVWIIASTSANLPALVADGQFRNDLLYRLQVLHIHVPPLRDRDSDVIWVAEHFLSGLAARYKRRTPRLNRLAKAKLIAHSWPGNMHELHAVLEQSIVLSEDDTIDADHLVLNDPYDTVSKHRSTLPDMEQTMLEQALAKAGGNVSRAAKLLGISRDTMRYRIAKFGLSNRKRKGTSQGL